MNLTTDVEAYKREEEGDRERDRDGERDRDRERDREREKGRKRDFTILITPLQFVHSGFWTST